LPKILFVIDFIYWPVILTRFMSGRIFCLMSVDVLFDSSLVSPGSPGSSTTSVTPWRQWWNV